MLFKQSAAVSFPFIHFRVCVSVHVHVCMCVCGGVCMHIYLYMPGCLCGTKRQFAGTGPSFMWALGIELRSLDFITTTVAHYASLPP